MFDLGKLRHASRVVAPWLPVEGFPDIRERGNALADAAADHHVEWDAASVESHTGAVPAALVELLLRKPAEPDPPVSPVSGR